MVFLNNFGFAKKYFDPAKQGHIPYRENKNFIGSVRFASINAHLGIEQSRRDDLVGLGYVLLYFYCGQLPWQGFKSSTIDEKHKRVTESKLSSSIETLTRGSPNVFSFYLNYCHALQFEDQPDYDYLRGPFRDFAGREGVEYDGVFDWSHFLKKEGCALPGEIRESEDDGLHASRDTTTTFEHGTIGHDTHICSSEEHTKHSPQDDDCGLSSRRSSYALRASAGVPHAWLDPCKGQDALGTPTQPRRNGLCKLNCFFASILRCGAKSMHRLQ